MPVSCFETKNLNDIGQERLKQLKYSDKYIKFVGCLLIVLDNIENIDIQRIQDVIDNISEKCPNCNSDKWMEGMYTDEGLVCGQCDRDFYYPSEFFA